MIQVIEASNASRVISASDSPTCRARFWRSGGNRPATIAMNTKLSIPSTISSAVSVTRLAQTCGSVSQSIPTAPRHSPPARFNRQVTAFITALLREALCIGVMKATTPSSCRRVWR